MSKPFQERKVGELDIVELLGDPDKGTIVLLHGFGADAFDLFPLSSLYKGPTWIFPQAPLEIQIAPGYFGRAWFPIDIEKLNLAIREKRFDEVSGAFPSELDHARACLEDLLIRLDIPRSKLLLGGFSQGAILAIETALTAPHRSAALLILSGTLINESNWRKLTPLHAKTPFFQSHGSHDPLLPIEKAIELEKVLLDGGLEGKLHRFNGGHEIPQATLLQLASFLKREVFLCS